MAETYGYDYLYFCQNNTIFGTQFHDIPNTGELPLVGDVSSCFLAEPIDVSGYGLLYAWRRTTMRWLRGRSSSSCARTSSA